MIGKNKMVDWKGAVRTWEQRDKADSKKSKPKMGDADYYENDSKWCCRSGHFVHSDN